MNKYLLLLLLNLFCIDIWSQTTIIGPANNGDFENATPGLNWNIVNPADFSLWYCNTFSKCSGNNAAYIGTASSNNNYTNTGSRRAHIYRDVTFPAGETTITLTFDWKGNGESTYDGLKVFLGSTGATPVANTAFTTTDGTAIQLGNTWYNLQGTTCTSASITIPAANAGTTKRLVFSWQQDGSGGSTPAITLDNVLLTSAPPPANDNCSGATSLSVGPTCTTTAGSTVSGYTSSGVGCTDGGYNLDVWYSFTATAATHTVTVNGASNFDAVVATYTSCAATTAATGGSCTDNTGSDGIETNVLTGLTIGNTYYIKVQDYGAGGGDFTICVQSPATAPANDDPCSSTGLDVLSSCSYTNYTTLGATSTTAGSPPAPGCASYSGGDVWFTATVPASGQLVFDSQTGVVTNGGMAIYSGTCGALTLIECDDDDGTGSMPYITRSGLTPGATIWIRFWEYGNDNNGTFGICVWDPCPVCSGTPTAATVSSSGTVCNGNSQVLTAAGGSTGCQFTFQWQSSTDNIGFTNITGATSTSYTASPTVTTYYRYVVTCIASGLSNNSNTVTLTVPIATTNVTAPFSDNFSSTCPNWVVVNGTEDNQWFLGSATGNTGQSMYISNTGGSTNNYTDWSSTVHFYKDVEFPAGLSCITLTFDWKSVGEAGYDEFAVFVAPTTYTPTAGTIPTGTLVGGWYAEQSTWQTATITLPSSYAGTTQRIIFTWDNSFWGPYQTPAAIDNIVVNATTPALPNCASAPSPANAATGICPITPSLSWAAPSGTCQNITGYLLYVGTDAGATNLINGTNIGLTTSYTLPTLNGSTVYYWKVVPVNSTGSATGCSTYSFTTSASPSATACETALGTGVTTVTLPYTLASGNTNNSNNNLTGANAVVCGSSDYYTGEDEVFVFTPTTSGSITISVNVTTSGADAGIMLYQGCPLNTGGCGTSPGICIANHQYLNSGVRTITACVQAGVKYFLVLDAYTTPEDYNYTNLTISAPAGAPSNDDPCTAIDLPISSTCSYATYSNACANTSTGIPSPGCASYSGSDVWFKVTVPSSGVLSIDTDDMVMTDGGMAVYTGTTCSALTLLACDDNSSANGSMPMLDLSGLTAGSSLYIRVWEYGNNNNGTFGICVTNPCPGGVPTNDACLNATALTLGTIVVGNNNCSFATNEPAKPSCWSSGSMNTIWYSVVIPASGQIKIRTIAATLANTQIQAFSGACGSTMTSVGCNDDADDCGGTYPETSELSLTGLTPGATYYIRVDGYLSTTGSFGIVVVDGTQSFPGSANQDCVEPGPVCSSIINVGNPGYQDYGLNCDLPSSYCLASSERNVVWYRIPIEANGNLTFNIIPNDYDGTYGSETDYDFGLWKVDGSTVTCATILAGSSIPVSCNYDSDGVTGLASGGNAPAPYSSWYNAAYEAPLAVAVGEVYYLAISNFSNSTSGFQLNFNASTLIDYTASPTTVAWTGGTNNLFNVNNNWGGCAIPTCGINAEVTPSSTNQPNVTAAISPQRVKDLMINPGATLTLGANAVLEVCGNFTNLGSLVCDPTSTVIFNGTGIQTVSGDLVGGNQFGNFTVTKASGSVVLASNIDIASNFTTSNASSVFNINGYYMSVAGNFTNSSGATTFIGVANSTVNFNGSAAQTYSPGGVLPLNNVTMSHSGPGVTITTTGTPNMIIGTAGILSLTNGKIITPGAQQVELRNTANASITAGNTASYVEGNLRRYLAAGATGSFDFPVGEATKGFQRANLNFTTAAAAGAIQLLARFDQWGTGGWNMPGAPGWGPECAATYNLPFLDNGYWSIDNYSGTSTGTYNITLNNLNYTNAGAGFSVSKAPSTTLNAWGLDGTCVAVCPVTAVQRNGLVGFSKFATIQSSVILPVQLLSFSANNKGTYNNVKWVSASEENLNRYELESSNNGTTFKLINTQVAKGQFNSNTSYLHEDYNFFSPQTYYRLKSIDNDGSHRYSSIITVENIQKSQMVTKVFPNPAINEVNVSMEIPFDTEMRMEIKDLLGRVVYSKTMNVSAGNQEFNINTQELSQGTYVISTYIDNLPETNNKLVISK